MPTKRSAVAALRKLEEDRIALEQRRSELEDAAALEIGQVILGTGLEAFSRKGLRAIATRLATLGEAESQKLLKDPAASRTDQTTKPVE
jgi:hypothetical protein